MTSLRMFDLTLLSSSFSNLLSLKEKQNVFLHPVIPIKHMIHCMLLDMFIRLFTKLNLNSSWKKFCTVKVQLLEQARYIYAKRWINLLIPTTCVPLSYDVFNPFNLFFSVLIIICVTKINVLIDLWLMTRQMINVRKHTSDGNGVHCSLTQILSTL